MSENHSCSGDCKHCSAKEKENQADCELKRALAGVRRKIVVMSGKGGVGKSTVAVNLACALAAQGFRTGLLDVDVHGPSIPTMLGLENVQPDSCDDKLLPAEACGVKVMSVGFLLEEPDTPVIWRGPAKIGVIRQFFTEVAWGELDFLVIDCPPGTGDEPLSVCQSVADGGVGLIVTTPQRVSAADVAKSVNFCRKLDFPICGIVENMSGFVCPKCGETTEIFASGAGEELARRYGIPFLGKLPIEPGICAGGDRGLPFAVAAPESVSARAFAPVAGAVAALLK